MSNPSQPAHNFLADGSVVIPSNLAMALFACYFGTGPRHHSAPKDTPPAPSTAAKAVTHETPTLFIPPAAPTIRVTRRGADADVPNPLTTTPAPANRPAQAGANDQQPR